MYNRLTVPTARRFQRLFGRGLVFALIVLAISGGFLWSEARAADYNSKSINDLRAEKERLDQIAAQKRAAAKEEADAAAAAKQAIVKLDGQIAASQIQIAKTSQNITDTQNGIDALSGQITDREGSIAKKADNIELTLRRYFILQLSRDHVGYVGIAFSQEGISQQIQEYQSYNALKGELQKQRDELLAEKTKLESDKNDLQGKKISLEGYKRQVEIQKQGLAQQQSTQVALKSNAEVAYAQLKKEEQQAISEEARIEAVITAKIQAQIRSRKFSAGKEAAGQGTPVSQGNVIGHLGSTGFSTGPHVHFSVFTPEGATVNPRTRLGSIYIWSVADYTISQEYGPAGWRNPVYSFHNGIDLAGPAGQPVFAGADGKIILDEYYGGYGNAVVIEHNDGWLTLYGHMTGN